LVNQNSPNCKQPTWQQDWDQINRSVLEEIRPNSIPALTGIDSAPPLVASIRNKIAKQTSLDTCRPFEQKPAVALESPNSWRHLLKPREKSVRRNKPGGGLNVPKGSKWLWSIGNTISNLH
jgi:hypothetical protein